MKNPLAELKPLGLFDAVGLIVGIIIGAGIFETPAKVMASVNSPWEALALWIGGAIVAVCGALCYAELAATYPTDAGEAEYLNHAFGAFAGWYFTWIQLVCFRTAAAIVSIAYVFAKYAQEIYPLRIGVYVTLIIVLLTFINSLGLRPGKWTQNLLATAKVSGLGGLIMAGFLITSDSGPVAEPSSATRPIALAVVLIMYAYSGWHETAYIVGDLRNPSRSLPRAMLIGVGLVTIVYLAVNIAAIQGLGFPALQSIGGESSNDNRFGPILFNRAGMSGLWFAGLVVIVTMGSTNGTILSGSRLFSTVGTMQPGYRWLAAWRTKRDAPLAALAIQMLICLAFVAVIEYRNQWLSLFGVKPPAGTSADGFDLIVAVTSPVLWIVFLSAGLALVVLRHREPTRVRPFTVPLYPLVPFVYLAGCLYMLVESTRYAVAQSGPELWLMLVLLVLGLPYWWFAAGDATSNRR